MLDESVEEWGYPVTKGVRWFTVCPLVIGDSPNPEMVVSPNRMNDLGIP